MPVSTAMENITHELSALTAALLLPSRIREGSGLLDLHSKKFKASCTPTCEQVKSHHGRELKMEGMPSKCELSTAVSAEAEYVEYLHVILVYQ